MRSLHVSFGTDHFSYVNSAEELTWDQLVERLSVAQTTADKAAAGWYVTAAFRDNYRDEEHMGSRECLTFDFDHIEPKDVERIIEIYQSFEYLLYTTYSHTKNHPRLRLVLPLSRPATPDEFRAVSRAIADLVGIDLVAPESHKPAQFMFMPTVSTNRKFKVKRNVGAWVDVDGTLSTYKDWTDRKSWPCAGNDTTYKSDDLPTPAREKPGVIGAFNRTFSITEAIERFNLPYEKVSETRWTYTKGSRPEGARIYDSNSKLHSENATDPARGQHSAFDLVRLHRYGKLDASSDGTDMSERPSFGAMVELARSIEAVRIEEAARGFDVLAPFTTDQQAEADRLYAARQNVPKPFEAVQVVTGPAIGVISEPAAGPALVLEAVAPGDPPAPAVAGDDPGDLRVTVPEPVQAIDPPDTLARPLSAVLSHATKPRWLLKDEIERGVIALMAGQRGSYKSFKALDWACRVALAHGPVYVVSAEGGDFDRRARAWVMTHAPEGVQPPLFVVERRLDLNSHDGIEAIRQDCLKLGIRPVLFVLDTFSKLSGGLDENDNTQVKQFIGRLDNGLKRADTGFDATVLLVAHTGHSDKGRARGASALGADTDAEYIVRRLENGKTTVTISRERFKASPELPPLIYAPLIVDLGYRDDEGGKVTSLVLQPCDPSGAPAARELQPVHKEALVFIYQFLAAGDREYEDVIRGMAAEMAPPVAEEGKPVRDTRIQKARSRFEVLEKRGYVRRKKGVGTNMVSRTAATSAGDAEFDDSEKEQE